jgi:hypothetical protein
MVKNVNLSFELVITDTKIEYCKHDKHHRDDGPAVIFNDGSQYWCQNGQYHRTDRPAIIFPKTNDQYWYQYGKIVYNF